MLKSVRATKPYFTNHFILLVANSQWSMVVNADIAFPDEAMHRHQNTYDLATVVMFQTFIKFNRDPDALYITP